MEHTGYIALPQVARLLHTSHRRCVKMIRDGELRGRLIDGHFWWIERESFEALLHARRRGLPVERKPQGGAA